MDKIYFTDRRNVRLDSELLFNDGNDVRKYMRVGLPDNIEALLVAEHGQKAVEQIMKYARVQVDLTTMPKQIEIDLVDAPNTVHDAIRNAEQVASYYAGLNPND